MIKPRFVIEDYDGDYVMHCPTEENAIAFLQYLHELGRTWSSGTSYAHVTNYRNYRENTCYDFTDGMYDEKSYYDDEGYTILEYDDFDWSDNPAPPEFLISFDDMFRGCSE